MQTPNCKHKISPSTQITATTNEGKNGSIRGARGPSPRPNQECKSARLTVMGVPFEFGGGNEQSRSIAVRMLQEMRERKQGDNLETRYGNQQYLKIFEKEFKVSFQISVEKENCNHMWNSRKFVKFRSPSSSIITTLLRLRTRMKTSFLPPLAAKQRKKKGKRCY